MTAAGIAISLQCDNYLYMLRLSPDRTRKVTTVHHIKELENYPKLAQTLSNLIICCYYCHKETKAKGWSCLVV